VTSLPHRVSKHREAQWRWDKMTTLRVVESLEFVNIQSICACRSRADRCRGAAIATAQAGNGAGGQAAGNATVARAVSSYIRAVEAIDLHLTRDRRRTSPNSSSLAAGSLAARNSSISART
jgi:hypothetical protein